MAGERAISDGGNIECPNFRGHFLGVRGEATLIPTQRTKLKPIANRAKAQSAMEIRSHLKHGEDSGGTPPGNSRDRQGLTGDTHIHRRQQSTRGTARGRGGKGRTLRNRHVTSGNTGGRRQKTLTKSGSLRLKASETIPSGFGKNRKVELKRHDDGSKQERWRKLEEGVRKTRRKVLVCNGGSKVING